MPSPRGWLLHDIDSWRRRIDCAHWRGIREVLLWNFLTFHVITNIIMSMSCNTGQWTTVHWICHFWFRSRLDQESQFTECIQLNISATTVNLELNSSSADIDEVIFRLLQHWNKLTSRVEVRNYTWCHSCCMSNLMVSLEEEVKSTSRKLEEISLNIVPVSIFCWNQTATFSLGSREQIPLTNGQSAT